MVYAAYAGKEGTEALLLGDNTCAQDDKLVKGDRGKADRKEEQNKLSSTQVKRREDFSKMLVSNATGHG